MDRYPFWHRPVTFLWICLAVSSLGASPVRATDREPPPLGEVRFELEPRLPPKVPLHGEIRLRPGDGRGEEILLPLSAEAPLAIKVPPEKTWEVSFKVQGYWTADRVLNPVRSGNPVTIRIPLWPTGTISGSLKMLDPGIEFPKDFSVRLEPPPAIRPRQESLKAILPCPVDQRGKWSCEIPAGRLDLGFRAKGFAPRYRWGVTVGVGENLSLGNLELRRGASLVGWAEVEGGPIEPGKCIARLAPLLGPGVGQPQGDDRLRRAVTEQPVGRDGFFQIDGIAPGTYRLEVEQPGYSPARALPVEVWDRSETALKQPLVLRRPISIELSLSPPLDWLGRPWEVSLQRRSDFSAGVEDRPAYQGPADAQGNVRVAGQSPGHFMVEVADSLGNRLLSEPDLAFDESPVAKRTLSLDLQDVHGRVTLGKEPLAATLWFGGRFGARHVKMEADREGRFRGVLPRGGKWRLQVAATDPRVEAHLEVTVREDRSRPAVVDVALPDTRVFGKVVDETGQAAEGARVDLGDLVDTASVETAEDGAFELRGIPAGSAELSARSKPGSARLTSDPMILAVDDGHPIGPLTLVLHPTKDLHGRVQSPYGPVPGAFVRASPLRPPLGNGAQARTDIDGNFSLRIDGKTEAAVVVVSPPGGSLKAFAVPVTTDPVVLDVSDAGGDLDIELPFALRDRTDRQLLIFQNGLPLPLPTLLLWTEGHGQKFERDSGVHVSNLAPGDYEVCLGPPQISIQGAALEALRTNARCETGALAPGSFLRLDFTKER